MSTAKFIAAVAGVFDDNFDAVLSGFETRDGLAAGYITRPTSFGTEDTFSNNWPYGFVTINETTFENYALAYPKAVENCMIVMRHAGESKDKTREVLQYYADAVYNIVYENPATRVNLGLCGYNVEDVQMDAVEYRRVENNTTKYFVIFIPLNISRIKQGE